jgi:hypothetical protein
LYDYYEDEKSDLTKYRKLRDMYEKELDIILKIAENMKYAKIPNYIDLLTITRVRQWGLLEDLYLNSKSIKFKIFINKSLHKIFKKA